MISFASLSSGSNGNCYYLSDGTTSFLIDVGIGGRTIRRRLADFGINVDDVSFVLVTHDHIDHIRHLGNFAERHHKPVYASSLLAESLYGHPSARGCVQAPLKLIEEGRAYCVGSIRFTAFTVPHDATHTDGYFIEMGGTSFVFLTDLGEPTDDVVEWCRRAEHIIIESNYDMDMLLQGTYPPELKSRIITGKGHLCNEQTASILKRSLHPSLKDVFLCHLSENNNTPQAAYHAVYDVLPDGVRLECLPRRNAKLWNF